MACICGNGIGTLREEYEEIKDKQELSDFLDSLETGDLLLFKSRGFTAWGIRTTLQTDWDHVGVVVVREAGTERVREDTDRKATALRKCSSLYCACSNGKNIHREVEVLEATSAGIHIYPLQERLARRLNHDAFVAVRKMQGFNKSGVDGITETFLKNVRGNGYAFFSLGTYAKLAVRKNFSDEKKRLQKTRTSNHLQKTEEESLRRAFCSELVAAYLISIGVFHDAASSEAFDPSMFNSSDDLIRNLLVEGVSYSKEVIILSPKGVGHSLFKRLFRDMQHSYKGRKTVAKVFPQHAMNQEEPPVEYRKIKSIVHAANNSNVVSRLRVQLEEGLAGFTGLGKNDEIISGENDILQQDRVISQQKISAK